MEVECFYADLHEISGNLTEAVGVCVALPVSLI